MRSRFALTISLGLALVGVGTLAGCGSGSSSPSVAKLSSGTGTAPTRKAAPQAAGGAQAPESGGLHSVMRIRIPGSNGVKFAACMRKHGVPNLPDPNGQDLITVGSANGVNPSSPAFRRALLVCQSMLPSALTSPQENAKEEQQALKFSTCMRAHGVPDFPDPTVTGGQVELQIVGTPGSDSSPRNPTFLAARQACRGESPFGRGGS